MRLSLNNKHEMLVRLLIYCELYLSKKKKAYFLALRDEIEPDLEETLQTILCNWLKQILTP